MRNLLKELYRKYDVMELIRCINPLHGYRNYREARTDTMSGYPNARALKDYLAILPDSSSLAIYYVDLLGLHNINELAGKKTGNSAITFTLHNTEKAVSLFDGKVFREDRGDEIVAVVTNLDENNANLIHSKIRNLCKTYRHEQLPEDFQLNVAIGYAYSPRSDDPFSILDEVKEKASIDKAKFYEQYPELERRKHRDISDKKPLVQANR
jgi:GGDEF domain-containing protein